MISSLNRIHSDLSFYDLGHFTYNHAEDLFKQFFGDSNPLLDDMFSSMGGSPFKSMGGQSFEDFRSFGGGSRARGPVKGQTVQHKLYLSLEELYNGTKKTMKVSRKRLNPDGRTTKQESKVSSAAFNLFMTALKIHRICDEMHFIL